MEEKNKKHEEKNKEQSTSEPKGHPAPADEMEELKKKCEEYLNGWKRERADFLNYKKEQTERIETLMQYANEELVLKLLPVLDNMCLAVEHIKDEGVIQIKKQFEDLFKKDGIEVIETIGKEFDPNTMEAVEEIEPSSIKAGGSPTPPEPGVVIEEVQRGYTMHGKIIRPARVRVTK